MSKIQVNTIEPQCGTNLTLGANNDTVSLGTGAGFTGGIDAVKWETTPQTGNFQATAGRGYFMNTTSGGLQLTTPASPSAGDIFAIADYARTFADNNLTIVPHASAKIGGKAANAVLNVSGQAATFVYIDATQGWINVQNAEDTETGAAFVAATGRTETTSGDFKIHTFTGPGTFTVTCAGNPAGSNTVDYLVVAGGASGGAANGGGGGGGAGGLRYSASTYCTPAPAPSAGTAVPVTATAFPITVGAGGAAVAIPSTPPAYERGNPGSNSIFSTISSAGGGGGGGGNCGSNQDGLSGGSGGGAGKGAPGAAGSGGSGNTPSVDPPQGNDGGAGGANSPNPVGNPNVGGGGGGAGAVGATAGPGVVGGDGGNGLVISINGSCSAYAGGGGGQAEGQPAPAQGSGGSGGGGSAGQSGSNGNAGSANTGGGGGGIDSVPNPVSSGAGGSGIVIIRYKYQ